MNKFMPREQKDGYIGYYPVTNKQEWEELPDVYKAMSWFPVKLADRTSRPECVVFNAIYIEPYRISAKVKVHVQEFQKIMFCNYDNPQLHLYEVDAVILENGRELRAEWRQDTRTGAFAVVDYRGVPVGKQGGYLGHVPDNIKETEDGFDHVWGYESKNRCHYEVTNPFR